MASRAKPAFPQLSRSHPLAQGIVLDVPMFEGSGQRANELAALTPGTITGASFVNTRYGYGLRFRGDTVNSDRLVLTPKPFQKDLAEFTLETLAYVRGYGNNGVLYTGRIELLFDSGVPGSLRIYAGFSSADGYWDIPVTFNQWNHIVVTYNTSSSANNPSVWINSVAQTVTRTTGPSGTKLTDPSSIRIGNTTSNTRAFEGDVAFTRLRNYRLSSLEVAQLYASPFQIYKKKSLLAELSAAADPGITAAYRTLMGAGA